jgi:hypothetical protein
MRVAIAVLVLSACTTLGPMPATTGVSAIPAQRPGFEAQLGAIPSFYLSRAAQDKSGGGPVLAFSTLFEPDRWLDLPGLLVGARLFGQSGDTPGEPYVGYRKQVDQLSLAAIVYGTGKRSTSKLASYHATRAGIELAADVPIWSPADWFALHAQASLAATRIKASGSYCVDVMGIAVDCDTMDQTKNTMIEGSVEGYFPAGTLTLGFDFGRRSTGVFHSSRVAIIGTTGQMPLLKNGAQVATDFYASIGLTMTVGLGAP